MKRRSVSRKKKLVKSRTRKGKARNKRRGLDLETLDDRLLLDADGLAITSPSTAEIRSGLTNVMNVTADDPAVTFSISGGDDAGQFSIDPASGALSFNSAPDHSSPADIGADNVYDVTVQVQDNFTNVVNQPIAITVLPPNVAPQVAAGTYNVFENDLSVGTVTATDANTGDAGGDTLTFSFANASDAETFQIDSNTGVLTFVVPPDFESGNTSHNVDVTVTDALGSTDTATQAITILNVDEPAIGNDGNVIFPAGQTASNTGTWSHPTGANVLLYATSGTVTKTGGGTWSWTGAGPNTASEVRFVTVGGVDDAGNAATTTFSVSGQNTAPIVEIDNSSVTVSESDIATNSGFLSDLDGDVATLFSTVGTIVDQGDGTWNWSLATTDGPVESQYVGIIATDSYGSSRARSFQLIVQNVAPTIAVDAATVTTPEGTTATNSGTYTDLGDDVVTVTSDIGTVTTNPDGTWTWSYLAPNGYALETVTLTATDSDGATATETFTLETLNVPPTIAADVATVTITEGDSATVTGTMSDQAIPEDTLTLTASIGTVTPGVGTWQWDYTSTDGPDESATVTITADDGDGGISMATFDLIVINAAPTVAVDNATVTVTEGATANNTGTVADAGADTTSLSASRGTVVDNGDGTWSWSLATQDGPDDSGTITITATDSDGDVSTVQFALTVDNAAPTIAVDGAPATVTVAEGGIASLTGTYSEAGPADPVSFSASVGTIVDNGDGTWAWSLATTDGTDESQTVTVTITDSEGAAGTDTFALVVNNVAPAIAVAENTVTVDEGTTATNTITVTDPGDDTIQTLTTSLGTPTDNGDGTWSWAYLAPNGPNTQTVTITATDSDGDTTTLDFTLQTNNVAPVVAADIPSITINEGETATVTGTMSDQAVPEDAITLTSSLDGSGATITPGSGTWSWNFTAADGEGLTQTVTVTAEDADSATSQTTFDLTVNNLPAALTVANSTVTVDEGQVAANSGTFSDPGVDAVTLTASLGTVVDAGGGNWTWSHTTSDGPADTQTVTITATDSDGAVSTISFDLTVDNVAPTIAADNATVSATEGSTASNSGTLGDAGTDALTLTADRGTVVDNGNGTWNWSLDTTDGPDETGNVTITVTDADGASTDVTFALTVSNVAPTIAADQAGVTINESETANMTGTHADVGDDIVSLTASIGSVSNHGDGTWSWSFNSTDGPAETQVVTITAEDHDGLSSTTTFNLTVQNVAPSVATNSATVTVNEGETAMNTGTYADVGADTVSLTADVGAIVDNGDGTWSWSFTTSDGPDDTQTVTVTVTDSDGATTSSTFALVVQNIASVLVADNATVTVGEGTTATNTGTITDAGGDAATLSASVGTVTNNGDGTWSWSLATTDGTEDSQTVTITATDDDGDVSTTTFELAVNNLPAALTVGTATVTVSEGATATNTGTYADPGDDTVTLAVSVGTISDTGGGGWSWSFATTDGATETQLVTVTATDSDGEVSTTTFNLTVNNVDPTLAIDNATVTVSEGALAGNSGTFADIGDDTVTVTASVGIITQDEQAGTWQWSFQTTDGVDDSQTVTITASDEDGGSASQQFNLVVNNLAPTVLADNATVTAAEGTTATNSGTFADAGGDAVTITADSGAVTQDNIAGTWSWSLTTTDGVDDSRTVTITATDDDGAASTATFQLDVTNTAPNVTVANATVDVAEGSTATNSGTFADDGTDTVTLTASVGTITQDNPGGTWSWSYNTSDGPDDSQQVEITATDSDGATTIASFQLNAINVAPTISTDSSFVSVNEGETATNTGTMADVGNDTVTLSASVGDVVDNGDGTWGWSFATTDGTEQSGPVTITATDDDGEQTTTSFTLIVSNLAPTVSVDNPSVTTTEGAVATNSGLFDDAGDDTIELSASIGEVVDSGGGVWNWTWAANDGPDDTGAVTITATDSDGAATTATFFIQVDNVAPTLTVDSAAITVNEAATAGNSGSMGDVGNDTVTIAASIGTVADNGNGTWNWEFTPTDGPDDSQTVTITVTDSDNVSTSVDFALTVDNVAPDLAINTDPVVVVEGATATNDGTILDAGADVVTLTATSGTITDNGDGTWSWSYDSTDGPDETQVVSITAEDEDSATTVGTFQLTVTNAAAVLTADNATVTVTEGATATNTGTVVDAGNDTVVVTASVGTVTENAGTWSWSYDSTDGPNESQTVTITSTDSDGATSDVTFELVVDNVAPVVTADNATLQIAEGSLGTNTGTFSDIGADVVNLSVDVGIITQDNAAGTWAWQWTPVDGPTTQIVTVTATDSDGQATSSTFTVTVDNVDPTIAADNATVVVSENAMATNTGTVTDPGDDELTISASLGTATLDQGGTWQWQYAAVDGPDSQTVTITITDSDGGTNQTTFDLTINNVAPVISADHATVAVNEAGTATNTGTFMDVGATDTITLTASLGTIVDNGNGTWNWSHTPADGPDESGTITVTATDSDGGQASQQFDLIVTNVAPDVEANEVSVAVTEGQTATNTGTYGDVGTDTVSLSANFGQLTDNGDGTWSWSYDTTDGPDDSQNVAITATDSDGDTSIAEFSLTVENATPSVAADNATVTTTEGSAVTNTGTYGDVGVDTITLAASLGAVTDNGDGTWSWTHTPSNGPADSGTITITATDSDGATSTVDFAMDVTNVAPAIATDNSTVAAVEGVNATNTGTFSDVGSDVLLLTASIGTVVDNGDGTWSWSHTPDNGPDSVTVTITATDEDDEAQAVSFDMTVSNAAPALSINNGTVTATQGALAANSGSYSDTPTDTVTLSTSLGQVVDNGDGTWSWSLDTSDSEAGASSVDITATDNDGDSSTMSFNLTIENAPPVVTIDTAVVTVSEGSAATNQGTLSDAGGDALTITASYGNVTDNGDGTWSWSVSTTDGPDESTTVVITATDPSGADATESFELNVENVAPTITADATSVGVGGR